MKTPGQFSAKINTPPALDEALIARVEARAQAFEKAPGWFFASEAAGLEHALDLLALIALARHHADEIAAYRSQLDTTQPALASVVAERDGLREALTELHEAALTGGFYDDYDKASAMLGRAQRALATKPAAEGGAS